VTTPLPQKQMRNAFEIPRHSKVAAAVKPRQSYKRGPDIVIVGSATSRRDAEKRFGMRWSRI
jgi:hypothetical protein